MNHSDFGNIMVGPLELSHAPLQELVSFAIVNTVDGKIFATEIKYEQGKHKSMAAEIKSTDNEAAIYLMDGIQKYKKMKWK